MGLCVRAPYGRARSAAINNGHFTNTLNSQLVYLAKGGLDGVGPSFSSSKVVSWKNR